MAIQFFKPEFDEREFESVEKFFNSKSAQSFSLGFKNKILHFLHSNNPCFLTKSGTLALYFALLRLNLKKGDEVILPVVVCEGVVNAIIQSKATPVFVDVDEKLANINPRLLEKKINKNTKVVIAVHYGGHPCEIKYIQYLCKKNNLVLIEDCAQALGAKVENNYCGNFGTYSIFSFYANKIITTGGEGGALLINREEDTAIYKDSLYFEGVLLDELSCAIGISQIKKLRYNIQKRRKISYLYDSHFSKLKYINNPAFNALNQPSYYQYVIDIDLNSLKINIQNFIEALKELGVEAYPDFIPNHQKAFYMNKLELDSKEFPIAGQISLERVALPCYPNMSDNDVLYVVECIKRILKVL